MRDWINTNYSSAHKSKPIGVYRVWRYKSIRGRSVTRNFFFVRVHDYSKPGRGITTIAKTSTRQEANAIFLKHEPDWQGEIPYFENVEKRYKKNQTYKSNPKNVKRYAGKS